MPVQIKISFHSSNPDSVWNRLAARLGREPTSAEARAEVRRILGRPEPESSKAVA